MFQISQKVICIAYRWDEPNVGPEFRECLDIKAITINQGIIGLAFEKYGLKFYDARCFIPFYSLDVTPILAQEARDRIVRERPEIIVNPKANQTW